MLLKLGHIRADWQVRSVDPAAALPVGQAAHGGMPSAATFLIHNTVDSHVGTEEALVADSCRMGLVCKGILQKWRIIYINCMLGM